MSASENLTEDGGSSNILSSLLSDATVIGGNAANTAISNALGGPTPTTYEAPVTVASSSTIMYVVLGFIVIVVLYFVARRG